jgi:hypothetical protein
VEGNESWLRVTIGSTGQLIVGKGAQLTAQKIQIKDGIFEVNGGTVILGGAEPGNDVTIKGKASSFTLKNGAKLTLKAPDGIQDLDMSKGGDASILVSVSQEVLIDGASIECYSGTGFSNPNPWVDHVPLDGYYAAGGNASVFLGSTSTLLTTVKSLTVKLQGGNGGRAANAQHPNTGSAGSKGGGYSDGGDVSGYVGSGGMTGVSFAGMETKINGLTVTATSGNGGRAGDGGGLPADYNSQYGSGGGGGYSGGDGGPFSSSYNAPPGQPGGKVSGNIGTGGDSIYEFTGSSLTVSGIDITASGGNGGAAGNGGSGSYYNGGGGGGYGGGSGCGMGPYSGTMITGGSGTVSGRVGAGGSL